MIAQILWTEKYMKEELILESDLNKISSESKCELDGSKVAAADSNTSRSPDMFNQTTNQCYGTRSNDRDACNFLI